MENQNVSDLNWKSKALDFIKGLTPKQIGTVLNEGDVMYNDHLDCFFVWRDHSLVMYVNEKSIPVLDPKPDPVCEPEQEEDFEWDICGKCGEPIYESGE